MNLSTISSHPSPSSPSFLSGSIRSRGLCPRHHRHWIGSRPRHQGDAPFGRIRLSTSHRLCSSLPQPTAREKRKKRSRCWPSLSLGKELQIGRNMFGGGVVEMMGKSYNLDLGKVEVIARDDNWPISRIFGLEIDARFLLSRPFNSSLKRSKFYSIKFSPTPIVKFLQIEIPISRHSI